MYRFLDTSANNLLCYKVNSFWLSGNAFHNTRLITFRKVGTETFFFKVEAKRDKTHLLHVCVRVGRSWCIRVHIINS